MCFVGSYITSETRDSQSPHRSGTLEQSLTFQAVNTLFRAVNWNFLELVRPSKNFDLSW